MVYSRLYFWKVGRAMARKPQYYKRVIPPGSPLPQFDDELVETGLDFSYQFYYSRL